MILNREGNSIKIQDQTGTRSISIFCRLQKTNRLHPIDKSINFFSQTVTDFHQRKPQGVVANSRSEEHTSELQSRPHLVCRLLLEKKKKINKQLSQTSCER